LGHAKEYAHAIGAFAPLALTPTSFKTINILQTFNPLDLSFICQDSLLDF
jgi:hypothetical protein